MPGKGSFPEGSLGCKTPFRVTEVRNDGEAPSCIALKIHFLRTSLAVQQLRLRTSTAGAVGSIPGRGTKILRAVQPKKKKIHFLPSFYKWSQVQVPLCAEQCPGRTYDLAQRNHGFVLGKLNSLHTKEAPLPRIFIK